MPMHESAMEAARVFAEKYLSGPSLNVAEIGSRDVNGTMRSIFAGHRYTGFDIEPGPSVDVVLPDPDRIEAGSRDYLGQFDAVISANTLEHTRRPWRVVSEMARILKRGGMVFLLVPMPNAHRYHAEPIDCWRCYTEGMRGLFQEAGLETIELYEAGDHDTVGIARKH